MSGGGAACFVPVLQFVGVSVSLRKLVVEVILSESSMCSTTKAG